MASKPTSDMGSHFSKLMAAIRTGTISFRKQSQLVSMIP